MSASTADIRHDSRNFDGVTLLQALVYQRAGDGDAALRCLQNLRSEPIAGLARSLSQILLESDASEALRLSRKWSPVVALPDARAASTDRAPRISPQRRKILQQMADGASNGQIAKRLRISENTVKWHLKTLYSLLGVSNRCAAAKQARLLSLIP
ncbi:MAG: LuxR C-terminal-related transcriptional regulator [Salinisphaera sp.]|nr:LuxR C-terminal-related transcriptional regulator [Salinisphaera sp.]